MMGLWLVQLCMIKLHHCVGGMTRKGQGRWSCAIYTLLDPLVVCCHGQITIKSSGDVVINYLIFACVAK